MYGEGWLVEEYRRLCEPDIMLKSMRYDFRKIEAKWRKIWDKERIYEPDLKEAKRPFYNLMMFPYPSAEGLHVGNMYAFTGSDIYGRFKRMQGYDVFEPIGLDGFGIHSENYALKVGKHPLEHAKKSEKNFYRQLRMIGNSFAWRERLETYNPDYYKWTQWIFTEMFRKGLAYRKKQAVNWCPTCKTVLADEQVISGRCERCGSKVARRELEQWFFKITDYAEKLLQNLEKLDWSEKVKIAQRNWIGRSEGAELEFEVKTKEKPNFVLLHSYGGSPGRNFFPWLKRELTKRGYKVQVPLLPHSDKKRANEKDDMAALWKQTKFNKNTVLLGHSLGAVVAMKAVEKLNHPIRKLIVVGGFIKPKFEDQPRFFEKTFNWKFNFTKIKRNAPDIRILHDLNDKVVPLSRAQELHTALGREPILFEAENMHFRGKREPVVLENCIDLIKVFTTRPDTLFGATYVVLAPEHRLIESLKTKVKNWREVERYIKRAKAKSEEERIAEGKEKTGVELKGIKAVNPATKKEIPIWVADYVLTGYGTGAIMAVPAHDQRDWEFAKKYNLPALTVICPNYPEKKCPALKEAYLGDGRLVSSGKFNGMNSEDAKWAITKAVHGKRKIQYRLRDWLISRQRYWGPPIPMIFCKKCNWQPVPEKDLPVKLPYVRNFKPLGTGKSPLASVKSFYQTKCPKCGGKAWRETDVSDTFLDSAWYYLRYLSVSDKKQAWDPEMVKKWLPVDMYIGGAEHSVLHLLYVRFLALALHDMKLLDFGASPAPKGEPFPVFRAHGLLIKEGAKMSKSKGNVVNPDEYIRKFGADAFRMYLMFLAPFSQGGDFRDEGIAGITRFLERVWRLGEAISESARSRESKAEILKTLNHTIKKVGEDMEELKFNTAISALMVLLSEMEKAGAENVGQKEWQTFLKLLAPLAPFMAEELYQKSQKLKVKSQKFHSVHLEPWPAYDPKMLQVQSISIVVQVNGRVRETLTVPADADEREVEKAALASDKVRKFLGDGRPKRAIYIPGRLINFVV